MPEYTTTEAAALLNTARRNVQNYARRHGLEKFGREYVITENDITAMRLELGRVGRKPVHETANEGRQKRSPGDV